MGEVIYGDIKQYIEEMANSLGVAAEHVYELLVRQQVISGVITIAAFVLAWAIFGAICTATTRKSETDKYGEVNGYAVISLLSGVVLVISLIFGFIEIAGAVKQLVNPEYYAIREIMDVFKGGN